MRKFTLPVWGLGLFVLLVVSACRTISVEHGPACADIRAAASANFSSDAAAGLERIAASPHLGAHEQIHLIDAAIESVSFSSDLADVLATLAANPVLKPEARDYLSRNLDAVSFSSDRQRIADAMIDNPQPHSDEVEAIESR